MTENYTKIKISVIVPVYNLENELERCVDSILNQTYKDLEIILVDDGSSDASGEIIDRYAALDQRVLPVHKKNQGAAQARISGVRQASGEYIGFVDGDDEIEADMYECLIQNAVKYQADISHCGYRRQYEDGRVRYFHNTGCLVKQDNAAGLKDLLCGSFFEPSLWNKLFHKSLFHSLLHRDLIPADIRINEDLLINFFLFQEAKMSVYEDVCKYIYHVRDGSTSRTTLNRYKIYDPIKVRMVMLENCREDLKPLMKQAYLDTCLNTYHSLIVEGGKEFREDNEEVWGLIKNQEKNFHVLSLKRRMMAKAILKAPGIYTRAYRFYAKHFQENPYV